MQLMSLCCVLSRLCRTMPKAAAKKKAPAKEKKEKKEKDPNAPKRPLTAYFLYANDMRPKVKADNPSFKVSSSRSAKARAVWAAY